MNSSVKKRSIVIGSHKTSISLEDAFWTCVRQIARERATTASELIGMLDAKRNGGNLSSIIRVFVLDHYRNNVASNRILSVNKEGRNLPARQSLQRSAISEGRHDPASVAGSASITESASVAEIVVVA